jgi:hypothetical protein
MSKETIEKVWRAIYEKLLEQDEGEEHMSNRILTKTVWLASLDELWVAALLQRPWQGLTDEEVAIASAEFDTRLKLAFHSGMYKAQIILRKKNDSTY